MILDAVRATFPISSINNPNTAIYQALTELLDGGGTVDSGVAVNETTAMRLVAVYACASLIAQTIAALPVRIVRKDDKSRTPIENPTHRAIWGRPNDEDTRVEALETSILSCLLGGNAYWYLVRDGGFNLAEMWPLDPRKVTPFRERGGERRKLYAVGDEVLDDREILHIPALRRAGSLTGMSPIAQARQTVGIGLAGDRFAASYYGNGTLIGGYLSTKGDLNEFQARALQRRWERSNAGVRRAHRVAVLDNAATFNPVSVNMADAQFLESRRFTIEEVARMYRVPPYMIGALDKTTSWGTGIEEMGIGFVVHTLRTWIVRYEQRFETLLGPGLQVKFIVDGLLRGNATARFQAYAQGRQWGWLSVNDINRLEDRPDIGPEGDIYLQPINMIPAGATGAASQRLLEARLETAASLVRIAGLGVDTALRALELPPEMAGALSVLVAAVDASAAT